MSLFLLCWRSKDTHHFVTGILVVFVSGFFNLCPSILLQLVEGSRGEQNLDSRG